MEQDASVPFRSGVLGTGGDKRFLKEPSHTDHFTSILGKWLDLKKQRHMWAVSFGNRKLRKSMKALFRYCCREVEFSLLFAEVP